MFNYRKHSNYIGSVLSFGAGVQSTAILLLVKYESDRFLKSVGMLPDYAIFADTGAENEKSLLNLERCHNELFPIIRVQNVKRNAHTHPEDIPVYFGKINGKETMNNERRCTSDWKVVPINRKISKLYPNKRKNKPVALMMGISVDEITRMKINKQKSIENIYPLIDLGLTRQDCYQILKRYGWEAVKSSCYMCPYQVKRWADNTEIDKAIAYEKRLQEASHYDNIPYLHPSGLPLADVYQRQSDQYDIWDFDNECFGVCGV